MARGSNRLGHRGGVGPLPPTRSVVKRARVPQAGRLDADPALDVRAQAQRPSSSGAAPESSRPVVPPPGLHARCGGVGRQQCSARSSSRLAVAFAAQKVTTGWRRPSRHVGPRPSGSRRPPRTRGRRTPHPRRCALRRPPPAPGRWRPGAPERVGTAPTSGSPTAAASASVDEPRPPSRSAAASALAIS